MPIKRYDLGTDPTVYDWDGGRTWIAHPDESMERASHALVIEDGSTLDSDEPPGDPAVWLVEPVDVEGLDSVLAELGPVAGVVVLAGLHQRDAAAVAERHGVAVHLPATVGGLAPQIHAPVEVFEGQLADTPFRAIQVLDGRPWSEAVLYDTESGTLVATEVLVTTDRATGPGERLAFGPWTRLRPPRDPFRDLAVERVLVGHGPPLVDGAQAALETALTNARRGMPAYLLKEGIFMLQAGYVAMRD